MEYLNLSYNFLEGQISGSLDKMLNLKSLDLSHNSLTGQVPGNISGLLQLGKLIFLGKDSVYVIQLRIYPNDYIVVGWEVDPISYGDNHTRLFGYYETNGQGCRNCLCPGFVQTSSKISLGQVYDKTSVTDGVQYDEEFIIYQDKFSQN